MKMDQNKSEQRDDSDSKIVQSDSEAEIQNSPTNFPQDVSYSSQMPLEDTKEKANRTRFLVIQEMIETEIKYVSDLKEIVEGYMTIVKDPNSEIGIPEDLKDGKDKIIFGNIEAIYEYHRNIFLKSCEKCLEHPKEIGNLFKKSEKRMIHLYNVYCLNKIKSEYIVSEHIDTYFEEIRLYLGQRLDLCSLLIKPVQRITRYQLLLQQILDLTEKIGDQEEIANVKIALNIMLVAPEEANNMMQVGRLQGFEGNIKSQGKLVLFGPLICFEGSNALNFKGKELQLFFFEQSIIFSESEGSKTRIPFYIYKNHIYVNKMSISERVDDKDPLKFIIKSTDPNKPDLSYVCLASSTENCDEWISNIKDKLLKQRQFLMALQAPLAYHQKYF